MAGGLIQQLLEKRRRESIPIYLNHGVFADKGPSRLERIPKLKEQGFPMFKWDPFRGSPEDEPTIAWQMA